MKKILIAEDDKFLANAYRLKLTKEGFEIRLASDGQEALDILKTFTPDIIILDVLMPGVDGFDALREIKSQPNLKNIPVIMASNLGQKEDMDKAKSLGAVDFIVKSDVSIGDIIKRVNAVSSQSLSPAQTQPAPIQQTQISTQPQPAPAISQPNPLPTQPPMQSAPASKPTES